MWSYTISSPAAADADIARCQAVVAEDWLPRMSQPEKEGLFDAWFLSAPASSALLALASCASVLGLQRHCDADHAAF